MEGSIFFTSYMKVIVSTLYPRQTDKLYRKRAKSSRGIEHNESFVLSLATITRKSAQVISSVYEKSGHVFVSVKQTLLVLVLLLIRRIWRLDRIIGIR